MDETAPKPKKIRTGRGAPDSERFSPEKKSAFLELYAVGGTVVGRAAEVGISHVTVFNHIRTDKVFARQFAIARETNTDWYEDHLARMAVEAKVPGNVLALFGTLKSRRPDKWRDNYKIEHGGSVLLTGAEQLQAARRRLTQSRGNGHDKATDTSGDRQ